MSSHIVIIYFFYYFCDTHQLIYNNYAWQLVFENGSGKFHYDRTQTCVYLYSQARPASIAKDSKALEVLSVLRPVANVAA